MSTKCFFCPQSLKNIFQEVKISGMVFFFFPPFIFVTSILIHTDDSSSFRLLYFCLVISIPFCFYAEYNKHVSILSFPHFSLIHSRPESLSKLNNFIYFFNLFLTRQKTCVGNIFFMSLIILS